MGQQPKVIMQTVNLVPRFSRGHVRPLLLVFSPSYASNTKYQNNLKGQGNFQPRVINPHLKAGELTRVTI